MAAKNWNDIFLEFWKKVKIYGLTYLFFRILREGWNAWINLFFQNFEKNLNTWINLFYQEVHTFYFLFFLRCFKYKKGILISPCTSIFDFKITKIKRLNVNFKKIKQKSILSISLSFRFRFVYLLSKIKLFDIFDKILS